MKTIIVGNRITQVAQGNPLRDTHVLQNQGAATINLALGGPGSDLSNSNGLQLAAGQIMVLDGAAAALNLEAITAGTSVLHLQEVFKE